MKRNVGLSNKDSLLRWRSLVVGEGKEDEDGDGFCMKNGPGLELSTPIFLPFYSPSLKKTYCSTLHIGGWATTRGELYASKLGQ